MLSALDDESFHDVRLVGTDNVEVPCVKFMLASRSPFFKNMFFGEFRERDDDQVSLSFSSTVLKILVKYCYTNELDLDLFMEAEALSDKEAAILIELRAAANYFQMTEVFVDITNYLGTCVFNDGEIECVCSILTELMSQLEDEGAFWNVFVELLVV